MNFGSEKKHSSVYLTEQVNIFRKADGNTKVLQHKNLLVKIEREFEEEISRLNILPSFYLAGNGKEEKCYYLTYEQSLQLLMSESKTVRKGVIQVLKTNGVPKTYSAALLEAGRLALELETTQAKLLEAQPKVEFYDAVTESTDCIDLGTAAKVLNIGFGRTTMFEKLRELKVLMPNNQPYQSEIDNGNFRVIETKWSKPNGDTHVYFKTMVFQKGLDYIRKLLTKQ
jgi:phage antirepressor YoqD-like protein